MKYALAILFVALFAVPATSKKLPMDDNDKVTFTKTIEVPEHSADEISLYASSFAKNNKWTNVTISNDTVGKIVTAKMGWFFKGTKDGCIGAMVIEAEMKVACRDHEATIFITNYTYKHYTYGTQTNKRIRPDKSREACDSTGTIEQLMDCPQCRGSQRKIYKKIKKNAKQFISDYKDQMKNPDEAKVNW
jgi:hypothetical protein